MLKSVDHGKNFCRLGAQSTQVSGGNLPDILAGSFLVVPQTEQFADIIYRKAKVAGAADEPQRMYFGRAVKPIASFGAFGRSDQTDFLLMPDHLGRHATVCGGLTNCVQLAHACWITFPR